LFESQLFLHHKEAQEAQLPLLISFVFLVLPGG